eukprot:jgi/Ulvmu1/5645/UM231_0008.1
MITWFERLFGFAETGYDATRSKFELRANKLIVKSTDESWTVGCFSPPSLQELRSITNHLSSEACGLQMSMAVGDVTQLLCAVENRRATFQVASQLNCLEFVHPDVAPEDGITGYSSDKTQGPACSIACGPATVYRNYFAPVTSRSGASELGQTTFAQINNADDLLLACGAADAGISFQSGYMQATDASLRVFNDCLATTDRDALLGKLKIGVHSDVQVQDLPEHTCDLCISQSRVFENVHVQNLRLKQRYSKLECLDMHLESRATRDWCYHVTSARSAPAKPSVTCVL